MLIVIESYFTCSIPANKLRAALRAACLFGSLTMLTACSPPFDWRTSKAATHGDIYTLEYPGKPLAAQRQVVLAEQAVVLTLNGVQIDNAQFALGHIAASNARQAEQLARALADSFARNLSASSDSTANASNHTAALKPVLLAQTEGALEYQSAFSGRYALARFIWTQHAAYELLAVGNTHDLPPEVAEQFIRSIKFEP